MYLLRPLSVLLPLLSTTHASAAPGACTGACNVHDPSVIQRGSDGSYFWFSTGGGISFAKASSLSGPWSSQGSVLPSGSSVHAAGNNGTDLWAPDVSYVDGTYYLYYAVSTFGSQASAIGLATSATMEAGSWVDRGAVGVASAKGAAYNAIDPNLIVAGGAYYLTFGSFWGDIYQVKMAGLQNKGNGAAYQVEYNATGTHPSEGSFVFYYGGYYYLLWSSGICCNHDKSRPAQGEEYKIMMCRSTSVSGGFVDKNGRACTQSGGSELLASHGNVYGPGGQGVFADKTRGLVLYYHYADTNVGVADSQYKLGWNTLSWSGGWPVV